LNDWFFKRGGRDRFINWMALDSKLNSTLGESWSRIKDHWNAGSSYFARFQLVGWRRLLNEFASESLTMMFGGFVVLYGLALPAFQEFDESKFQTGKYAVTFLDVNGNEIGKRGILHNDAVPLDQIPDVLIKATLATEDRRFFEHYGIDVFGTMRALLTNVQANEVVQGGSTLTQQLAKNLFLSSERSLQRKIKELFLAFLLESRYSKRQILKLYFDRAYMGGGTFGVEAASQYYFGKSVRDINMAESAMLAGLFKAPTKYSPLVDLAASRARTNQVLDNLVEAGYYTAGQVHAARMNPAKIVESRPSSSPDWFLDWAYEEVQRLAEGKGQYVLTARTTID
jgi:penicillin-binding protein 1A